MLNNGNDVSNLADGWLELESDPGLFTLLLEDMGVEGVQVEEIYDLQAEPLVQPSIPEDKKRIAQLSKDYDNGIGSQEAVTSNAGNVKSSALGFIFLFRWVEERRARLRKIIDEEHLYVTDENTVNRSLFFAQQIVPNSCATHALISILLNIPEDDNRMKLGKTLEQFKQHVDGMDPEMKGLAIGNSPELAQAHNSHAVPRARRRQDNTGRNSSGMGLQGAVQTSAMRQSASSQQGVNTETFHFVSYVPINGHLFELDGLKRYPIDHGPIPEGTDWTEAFRKIIKERLGMATSDIRFALMALTPDPRNATLERLNMLRTNRTIVIHALKQMVSHTSRNDTCVENTETFTEDRVNTNTALMHNVTDNVKCETIDMELEDGEDDLQSMEEIKELEKDVKQALAQGANIEPNANVLNKLNENKHSLPDSSTFKGLSTPPKPRRATNSRTNSLESNGTGIAPGSPFQNNPLLVSHDYSKSPMLIDQENDEAQADTIAYHDELEISNEQKHNLINTKHVTDNDNDLKSSGDSISSCINHPVPEKVQANVEKEDVLQNEGALAKVNESSQDSLNEPMRKNGKQCEMNDTASFDPKSSRLNSPHRFSPSSLLSLLRNIEVDISDCRSILKEANERRRRHAIDDCRRSHDYDQFITAFLSMLAERGHLGDLLEHGINVAKKKYQSTNGTSNMSGNSAGGSEGSEMS